MSRPHRCKDGSCVVVTAPCDHVKDCPDGSDEINCTYTGYEVEGDDYDDYFDEDIESKTEGPPPMTIPATTTTTTPSVTKKTKPKKEMDEKETMIEDETSHEDETFNESVPGETPTELEEPQNDVQDEEAAETLLENVGEGESAASSEQGGGSSTCVAPAAGILVLTSLYVINSCSIWMR